MKIFRFTPRTFAAALYMAAAFTLISCGNGPQEPHREQPLHITKVFDFKPGAGQFVNELPLYEEGDTQETMNGKALAAIGNNNRSMVSLGGFGGYIVVGFDGTIANSGGYDFQILGNPHASSSEPGIVWVMQDENGDGLPNDTWHELRGSEYGKPETIQDYWITYYRPTEPQMPVQWSDSEGEQGSVDYLKSFHDQGYYYPFWIEEDSYTLQGTRLEARTREDSPNQWVNDYFEWGYADNFSPEDRFAGAGGLGANANHFKISDAVTSEGQPANLQYIDFIKVQTGVNAKAGWTGELSTEILGISSILN